MNCGEPGRPSSAFRQGVSVSIQKRGRTVRHTLVLLAVMLAPFPISSARAQVTVDVSKITCEQFVLYQITDADNIAVWLHGYHSGKRGTTMVDVQTFKQNANKLKRYCRMNIKVTVMQAVDAVLGAGK